jgi:hypothetical protein
LHVQKGHGHKKKDKKGDDSEKTGFPATTTTTSTTKPYASSAAADAGGWGTKKTSQTTKDKQVESEKPSSQPSASPALKGGAGIKGCRVDADCAVGRTNAAAGHLWACKAGVCFDLTAVQQVSQDLKPLPILNVSGEEGGTGAGGCAG